MSYEIQNLNNWSLDPTNEGRHGEGCLEKIVLFEPSTNNRFLFKKWWSRNKMVNEKLYFDENKKQIWNELICFYVGKDIFELEIPETFIGYRASSDFKYGVTSKWFVNNDNFTKGSELLEQKIKNYKESEQNLTDILEVLVNDLEIKSAAYWWLDACLFDFIIGNTDRHHENWGVLKISKGNYKMSPLFDNGVSFDFRSVNKTDYDYSKSISRYRANNFVNKNDKERSIGAILNYFKAESSFLNHKNQLIQRFNSGKLRNILNSVKDLSKILPEDFQINEFHIEHMYNFIETRVKYLKEFR